MFDFFVVLTVYFLNGLCCKWKSRKGDHKIYATWLTSLKPKGVIVLKHVVFYKSLKITAIAASDLTHSSTG